MNDEMEIRALIERWAESIRRRDLPGILASHADDIVMFDVPLPFQSVGLKEYSSTWDMFFKGTAPGRFDIKGLKIFSGNDIAFCVATMACSWNNQGRFEDLDFRLTVGLTKINGRWIVVHEHHSVPAEG